MRLFVAVDVSDEVRQTLWRVSKDLQGRLRVSANWVRPENYHITLMFIGERDMKDLAHITNLLSGIKAFAFELQLSGVGRFGSRVLWVGVKHFDESLQRLSKEVNDLLGGDFARFHPHITLARIKSRYWRLPSVNVPPISWKVDKFVLYQSMLSPDGPTYIPLADFSLIK